MYCFLMTEGPPGRAKCYSLMLVKPHLPPGGSEGWTALVPLSRWSGRVVCWSNSKQPCIVGHIACSPRGQPHPLTCLCVLSEHRYLWMWAIYISTYMYNGHDGKFTHPIITLILIVWLVRARNSARYLGLALNKWQRLPSWDWHFSGFKGKQHLFLRDLGKADDLETY